jgi:hypothetical protein
MVVVLGLVLILQHHLGILEHLPQQIVAVEAVVVADQLNQLVAVELAVLEL